MTVKIVDTSGVLYESVNAVEVVLPSLKEHFSIRDFHFSFVAALKKGTIVVLNDENDSKTGKVFFDVSQGLAKMKDNVLEILVTA